MGLRPRRPRWRERPPWIALLLALAVAASGDGLSSAAQPDLGPQLADDLELEIAPHSVEVGTRGGARQLLRSALGWRARAHTHTCTAGALGLQAGKGGEE